MSRKQEKKKKPRPDDENISHLKADVFYALNSLEKEGLSIKNIIWFLEQQKHRFMEKLEE